MEKSVQEVWVKHLELVTRSSIRINRLDILEEMIKILHNLHRVKLAWLKVDELSWRMFSSEISEEIVEALNLIKHINLSVIGLSQSFYNLKMCMLLNLNEYKYWILCSIWYNAWVNIFELKDPFFLILIRTKNSTSTQSQQHFESLLKDSKV